MEIEIFYSTWHRPDSVSFSRHSILNSDQNLSQFLCADLYLNHFSNCFTSEVFTKWNSYGGTPINEQQKNDRHHPNKTAGNVLPHPNSNATLAEAHMFVCIASELLTDRQASETPTAVYSWDEQRGKPVLPGLIYPSGLMEPPTSFEQPSDCLTLNFHIETQHQSAAQ